MSHRSFHFYHKETGVLHQTSMQTDLAIGADAWAKLNCPDGHEFIEGAFDHLSQRIDVQTGKPVDHQPPRPTSDHEWHADSKRWRLTDQAKAKIDAAASARQQIVNLEAVQHRVVREALLGKVGAKERLQAIDAQIAELEKALEQ